MKNNKKLLTFLVLFVLFGSIQAIAQTRVIRGKITSKKDGKVLTGATITVPETNKTTNSNENGEYALVVSNTDTKLSITSVGFKDQSVDIPANSDIVNLVLEEDVVGINAVTVTALGIKKEQRSLGFSSQTVTGTELNGSGEQNVISAISSKIAGALVTGSGGTPGASTKIILRGAATFTGNNQPLVVIDGVPIDNSTDQSTAGDYPFNSNLQGVNNSNRAVDINPDDIENINVLKGPAAAALYGVRGANGAIIITTKRGKAGVGGKNFSVTYSTSVEFSKVNKFPIKQLKYGQGSGGGKFIGTPWGNDTAVNPNGTSSVTSQSWGPEVSNPVNNLENFFKNGTTYNNNLSFSMGGENNSVRVSLGNLAQDGIVPNSKFKRTSIRVNTDSRLSDKVMIGTSLSLINSGGTRVQNGSNLSGVMLSLLRAPSDFDLAAGTGEKNYKNPDGSMYTYFPPYDNPYWSVYENPFTDNVNRILGNAYITYAPLDWLSATYRLGTDQYTDTRKQIFAVGSNQPDNAPGGEVSHDILRYKEIYSDLMVTGRKKFNEDIHGSLTLGNNLNTRYNSDNYMRGRDLSVPDFYNLSNATNLYTSNSESTVKTAAMLFSGELSYKRMVYLNVTARNEWASTFGEEKNNFLYPSVNTSFVFTELMKANKWLSFGKLRLAYAQAGINPPAYNTKTYFAQPFFSDGFTSGLSFPYIGVNGFGQSNSLGNTNLRPEKTTGKEIGFDLRFLEGRFNLDLTMYNQTSTDILVNMPLAPSSGYMNVLNNAGKMVNKGIEMIISGKPVATKDFTWDIALNFGRNRNEVLALAPGVDEIDIETAFSSNGSYAIVGQPYGVLYGTKWQRNSSGQLLIGNNGMPLVDPNRGRIGNPYPKWIAGLRNTVSYKGVNLTFLFDFRKGGDVWNGTYARLNNLGLTEESEARDKSYLIEGVRASDGQANAKYVSAADYFRTYKGDAGSYASENAVQDGGWTRLREVGVSYTIKLPSNKYMQSIDVALIGKNVWLKTKYKGVDPETSLTGASSNIGGFDYFNNPGMKSWTLSAKFNI